MTKINDPKNLNGKLFGYEIKYNQVEGLETPNAAYQDLKVKPRYNGNIAEVDWRTSTDPNDYLRRYGYVYDKFNRLSAGFYQRDDNASAQEYFEKIDYDLNGNIANLKRSAAKGQNTTAAAIDNLTYVYANNNASNRLVSVTDSSADYRGYPDISGIPVTYDENGNITSQKDKGILQINYNFQNLPDNMTFDKTYVPRVNLGGTGSFNVNTQYLYRADGVKVKKLYTYGSGLANKETSTVTEYLDGFQYEATSSTGRFTLGLKFVPTAEGYYNFENNKYIYNYVDHLGNVRLSYFKNGSSTEVLEENNYYPFGLKHEGYNPLPANPSYQYKYNGKELQTESGMYDYGARFYMPDIGRWGVVDPLAEMMRRYSPYNYVFNNPINFIDPDGRAPEGGPGDGTDGKTYNIQEVVITVRRNTNNFFSRLWNGIQSTFKNQYSHKTNTDKYGGLNSYRQWQGSPFYNKGETKMDRIFRLMGNSKNEEMLNFGGGAYNMNGGYGRVTNVSKAVEVTPEVNFSNTPSPITSAYVNGTQVGIIDYSGSAVKIEINLSNDMQGMGIGSKIFNTAVEGETAFEAQWVQSTKLYGETGASQNLIQYNNAIQKGASPTEAAWSTWSGNQAKRNGFNNVNVQPMQNGIKATFTKE